jgi:hypothetical protein
MVADLSVQQPRAADPGGHYSRPYFAAPSGQGSYPLPYRPAPRSNFGQ